MNAQQAHNAMDMCRVESYPVQITYNPQRDEFVFDFMSISQAEDICWQINQTSAQAVIQVAKRLT